jgi:hypothetical protein
MFRRKFFVTAILGALASMASPGTSKAAFTVTLHEVGFTDVTITDNGVGDSDPNAGYIQTNQAFGDFFIVANFATSNSADNVSPAQLGIQNTDATTNRTFTGTKTLTITVEDTNFNAPGSGWDKVTTALQALSNGGTVTYQTYVDGDAGTLQSLSAIGTKTGTDYTYVGSTPYSIKGVLTITMSAGVRSFRVQGDSTVEPGVNPVPAPGGLILAATAVPFFGLLRRRLRRTEAATV